MKRPLDGDGAFPEQVQPKGARTSSAPCPKTRLTVLNRRTRTCVFDEDVDLSNAPAVWHLVQEAIYIQPTDHCRFFFFHRSGDCQISSAYLTKWAGQPVCQIFYLLYPRGFLDDVRIALQRLVASSLSEAHQDFHQFLLDAHAMLEMPTFDDVAKLYKRLRNAGVNRHYLGFDLDSIAYPLRILLALDTLGSLPEIDVHWFGHFWPCLGSHGFSQPLQQELDLFTSLASDLSRIDPTRHDYVPWLLGKSQPALALEPAGANRLREFIQDVFSTFCIKSDDFFRLPPRPPANRSVRLIVTTRLTRLPLFDAVIDLSQTQAVWDRLHQPPSRTCGPH